MWVKEHQGIDGNEVADQRAKQEVEMGWRMHNPDIATPAGIWQAHPMHHKAPAHMRWAPKGDQRFGLCDNGDIEPQRQWLWDQESE